MPRARGGLVSGSPIRWWRQLLTLVEVLLSVRLTCWLVVILLLFLKLVRSLRLCIGTMVPRLVMSVQVTRWF